MLEAMRWPAVRILAQSSLYLFTRRFRQGVLGLVPVVMKMIRHKVSLSASAV